LWDHPAGSPEAEALAGGGIQNYFFVARSRMAFMGVRSNDPLRARELVPELFAASREMPGSIFVVNQRSLFDRRRGQGRNVDIDISGPDLDRLVALGREVFGGVRTELPEAQARPIPSLDLGNPEVRVRTHRRRAADLGLSNRELAFAVSVLVDGAKASDFRYEGQEIDLVLKAEPGAAHRTHLLEQLPIAAPDGSLVTLGAVADVTLASGPVQINHRERQRTVTIRVTPPATMPLETAVQVIEERITGPMREAGRLGGLYDATFSGAARKLVETARALRWNLLLALVIIYLLMAALFENFVHPLVILFSVPLATLGGFLGLRLMNLFTTQPLDVLTMLGFIILIGTVVNNAILIVHQTLNHIRHEGLDRREAIREAVRIRMRPIFMSVSTSVLGMLPLVLFPGAGAELYRGLGSVVVGGLALSAVFTLVLIPALFSLSLDAEAAVAAWAARFSRAGRSAAFPGDSP
jgi:HAE1 family hydrophobic/amphiphilic exporter-1